MGRYIRGLGSEYPRRHGRKFVFQIHVRRNGACSQLTQGFGSARQLKQPLRSAVTDFRSVRSRGELLNVRSRGETTADGQ